MPTIEYKFKAVGQHEVIAALRAISKERDRFIMKWIPALLLVVGTLWFAGVAQVSMRLAVIGVYVAIGFAGLSLICRGCSELLTRSKRASLGRNCNDSDRARPSAQALVYDKAFVYINGKILGHAESVNVDIERKAGVDGKAERALRARVVSFIPASGLEFDAVSMLATDTKVELKLRLGGSGATLTSNGLITYASVVSSAKDASRLEFEFNGEPATFVVPEHPLAEAKRALNEAAYARSKPA